MTLLGFELPVPVISLGVVLGLTYGLLAVGLVLVYRSNRIINFAHGEIGAFGAVVFGLLTIRLPVPYYLALPLALAAAAGVGALSEVAVVRRLRNAPRLMTIVATLGVGQFLVIFSTVINSEGGIGTLYPEPPGMPVFDIGALRVTQAYSGMLLLTPVVVLVLVAFLRRSRYGMAIRGAATNRELARLSGIFAGRMSSLSWAIAGALSAFTAILFFPSRGFVSGDAFGPGLLLRALVAAVIARMQSLPLALAGGVAVGVVEQLLLWNYPQGGLVEMVLFGIILVALLLQRRLGGREDEVGSWASVQAWAPIPEQFREVWAIRNGPRIFGGIGIVAALLLPLLVNNTDAGILVTIAAFAIVGLSVGVVTGLNGQLSLGQFALAGIGAVVSFYTATRTGNYVLAFLYAGGAAAIASLLIGLPALRLRGLLLAVTTLSFALATPAWLLGQPWMLGSNGVEPGRPIVAGTAVVGGRAYYYVALATLVVVMLLARNIRRGGIGRRLVAVRDNENNARAFTVSAARVKVEAFMLAGFLAGIGGAVYGHSFAVMSTNAFPSSASINVVVMAVVGGIGILSGPLLGALFVIGVPAFVPLDSAGLAATSLGLLIIILYTPGGIAQVLEPLRDRIVDRLARREGLPVDTIRAQSEGVSDEERIVVADTDVFARSRDDTDQRRPRGTTLLRVDGIQKHFGGVRAVDGVSLTVRTGQTVGLIGPNGAGKTTLFELIGGFTRPDAGTVVFDGLDVTHASPEERAREGLIRSFQDAALFPTLSVIECVMLSLEKVQPTVLLPSLLGMSAGERAKEEHARELVAFMGLDPYRNKQIGSLSTGTRRITELACLVALRPTLLLLDEPSSGVAQRETEALGDLLRKLKRELDSTLVVIEHDIPLIMGLADEIVAMDTGRVIAAGAPEVVRHDPQVVEAYLGGSDVAIERSGAMA